MENKYLPIGTVCTLKGKNKKVMITGFYSVEFSGNLKIKDYCCCAYPEGMLLPEFISSFNHDDIENIDFLGYKNEENKVFNSLFDRLTGNGTDENIAAKFHKENDMYLTSNSTYSKLLFDENGVVMIAEPIKSQNSSDLEKNSEYEFDKDGYVISENKKAVENPFIFKESLNSNKKLDENKQFPSIFKDIEFDENGVVTSSTEKSSKTAEPKNKYEFDENGVVTSSIERSSKTAEPKSKYEFDENGVVTSSIERSSKTAEPKSKYEFDENGVVTSSAEKSSKTAEPKSKYEFDENGVVTSSN